MLHETHTTTYNLSAIEPDYFQRAASEPDDYLGQRILNEWTHRPRWYVFDGALPPGRGGHQGHQVYSGGFRVA